MHGARCISNVTSSVHLGFGPIRQVAPLLRLGVFYPSLLFLLKRLAPLARLQNHSFLRRIRFTLSSSGAGTPLGVLSCSPQPPIHLSPWTHLVLHPYLTLDTSRPTHLAPPPVLTSRPSSRHSRRPSATHSKNDSAPHAPATASRLLDPLPRQMIARLSEAARWDLWVASPPAGASLYASTHPRWPCRSG